VLTFTVYGRPAPKGSMRGVVAYRRSKGYRVQMFNDNPRTSTWQELVAFAACAARARLQRSDVLYGKRVPVSVVLAFLLPCPVKLRTRRDARPTSKRDDLDKLQRALFDALTGVVWHDDAQVVHVSASKRYAREGERVGVHVQISGVDEPCPTSVDAL